MRSVPVSTAHLWSQAGGPDRVQSLGTTSSITRQECGCPIVCTATTIITLIELIPWPHNGRFASLIQRCAGLTCIDSVRRRPEALQQQRPYFFNPATQESTWSQPADVPNEQLSSLPGAELLSGGQSSKPAAGSNDKVRASHLLVKWSGSRRPASWKEVCDSPLCRQ